MSNNSFYTKVLNQLKYRAEQFNKMNKGTIAVSGLCLALTSTFLYFNDKKFNSFETYMKDSLKI